MKRSETPCTTFTAGAGRGRPHKLPPPRPPPPAGRPPPRLPAPLRDDALARVLCTARGWTSPDADFDDLKGFTVTALKLAHGLPDSSTATRSATSSPPRQSVRRARQCTAGGIRVGHTAPGV